MKWLGLLLAFGAWLSRLYYLGDFDPTHLAPSLLQLAASVVSVFSIWMICSGSTLDKIEARLMTLWLVADVMFTLAYKVNQKIFLLLGILFYGSAHLLFAYKTTPKGRISLKATMVLVAVLFWSAFVLTGEHGSTLAHIVLFLYAQLVIMFVTFAVANAFLKSFGDWGKNALALGALLFLAGDLTITMSLINSSVGASIGLDKIKFDLTAALFGTSQLLICVSAAFTHTRSKHEQGQGQGQEAA